MSKNYLLIYSEQLATEIEMLCQNIMVSSNTLFRIRKSSSSMYANIREANFKQVCCGNALFSLTTKPHYDKIYL